MIVLLELIVFFDYVSSVEVRSSRRKNVMVPQVSTLSVPASEFIIHLTLLLFDELRLSAHQPHLTHSVLVRLFVI